VAGNLTRINNNQITDAVSGNTQFGINANTKIQPYSITSTLLANNLTYGSNLVISGDLTVNGNSTAIDTTNTTIEDPLLLLASTQTGSPTVDIGFIGQRGTANNIAFVWDESLQTFVTVFTSSGAGDHTNIAILGYADLKTANANVTGDLIAGNVSLNGNVTSPLNVTGNIAAGNIYAVGMISASGNVETGGFFMGDGSMISNINAGNVATYRISNGNSSANIGTPAGNMVVTINGALVSTFYDSGVSVAGNVTTNAALNTANLSLSGNVVSDLNVTTTVTAGNLSVIGTITSGNIIPSANVTYTLGNATNQFAAAYLGTNTLYLGTTQIGADNGPNVATVNNEIIVVYKNANLDISAGGNVSAFNSLNSDQLSLSGNVISDLNVTTNTTAQNLYATTTVSSAGNVSAFDSVNSNQLSLSGNVISDLNVTTNTTAQNLYATTTVSSAGNVSAFDSVNSNQLSLSGNVISALNVTLDATAQNLYATTTVSSAGNVNAFDSLNANQLSLSGNVIANLNATYNVNANNVTTVNYVSATGNVYGANFATTGAQGNITGANIVSAITFTATGNVYASSIEASANISATGNISTQQTFVGNALRGNALTITSTADGLLFSVTGNINVNNTYINNVPSPEQATDAVNKAYVDGSISGLQVKGSSNTATTGNILTTTGQSYVYNNGASGVGATITFNATGNVTIDGVQLTSGMRVLIKNEPLVPVTDGTTPSAAYNGIYDVTTAGSPSAALVLTRSADNDVASDMYNAYTFITSPGTSDNSSSGWASTNTITNPGPLVIGTTYYNWVQFSAAGEYTGGNAIAVTGTLIDALYDGNTIAVNGSNQLHIPANALLTTPNIGDATGSNLSILGSVIGNIFQANTISVIGNAQIGNVSTGNLSLTGNVLTNLNVTADVNAGNLVSYGLLSVVGNALVGNITTGNISVVGNVLTDLNITTNVTANNVYAVNNFSTVGNVYGGNISSANIYDTNIGAGHIVFGNADSTGRLSSTSTLTTDGNNISAGGNVSVGGAVSATGNVTAANFSTSGSGGNITGANVISGITLTASGNVYGQNLVTPNTTIGGNVLTTGLISATGNIQTANYFIGDGAYISNINAANVSSTKISNGGSYANIASANGNLVIAVGSSSNVAATFYDTGVDFVGNLSTTGNVTGANFVGNLSGGLGSNLTVNNYVIQGGNYNGITLAMPVGFGANLSSAFEGGVTLAAGTSGTTAGTLVLDQTGNVSASGNVYAAGNLTGANILTIGNVSATGNAIAGNLLTAGDVSATANVIGGNILTAGNVSATGNIQSGTTMLVDTTTSSVSLGANVVETTGATLAINATDSMLLPVGNTLQRPATPATGMLRYNSTVSQCEIWNGAAWVAVGGSSYTVITNEQFNGDGTTVQFTLGSSQTTDSCIVTINGVVQIPTTAYSVSGVYPTCYLTFTEAPEIGDTIDVREITTTTSVTAISNSPGNAVVSVSQTSGEVDITGNLVAQLNASAPSLVANSSMSFQLVNNTTLKILVRGTDGTTRSANITLS
jgi:hypothetical protein